MHIEHIGMKLQLFIVAVLKYLVQTSKAEGETQLPAMQDSQDLFDDAYFDSIYNSTFSSYDNGQSDSCDVIAPGFNTVALMIIYIIVFVFSFVGNIVVVYVVCFMKKGRASTDIYLMNLALADLLFSLTLPFWAVEAHFGWIFGNLPCKVLSGFQETSVYSGVFLLACISVDRYLAIVRATRVLPSHHLVVKVVCSVVWTSAGLLALPVAIKRESMYAEDVKLFICYENLTSESSDQWRVNVRVLRHTMGFFLPLVVMTVCYCWTIVTLIPTRNQHKHKAMRVILAVVFAFILCWLPYNVSVLFDTLKRGGSFKVNTCETIHRLNVVLHVTQVLAYMHCAVNPVLYAFIGEKFRNELLSALYKHGVISMRFLVAHKRGSVNSNRSRNTSVTM